MSDFWLGFIVGSVPALVICGITAWVAFRQTKLVAYMAHDVTTVHGHCINLRADARNACDSAQRYRNECRRCAAEAHAAVDTMDKPEGTK